MNHQDTDEKSKELYSNVLNLVKHKRKYGEIRKFLIDEGVDETTAKTIIDSALKKKAKDEMIRGALLALAGVATTALLYFLTPPNSVFYLLVYGPVVSGFILFIKGVYNYK
jgi:hypothetical protein